MQITIFKKANLKYNKNDKQKAAMFATEGEISNISKNIDFLETILEHTWSTGIFKGNNRKNDNFIKSYFIAFDIDDTLSLKEAIGRINLFGFTCIIGTTVNHQKEKDGLLADRYRVIFPLQNPILTKAEYKATWLSVAGDAGGMLFGADISCKDPARFFFPCDKVTFIKGYKRLESVKGLVDIKEEKEVKSIKIEGKKGRLSQRTKKFLEEGIENGKRHHEFVIALMDMKAQEYDKEEALKIMLPIMKIIKPSENVEKQVNYIYDKYDVKFDYRS